MVIYSFVRCSYAGCFVELGSLRLLARACAARRLPSLFSFLPDPDQTWESVRFEEEKDRHTVTGMPFDWSVIGDA